MIKIKNKTSNFIKNHLNTKKKKIFFYSISFLILFIFIFGWISQKYLIEIPAMGGTLSEIVINSTPRFINPVLINTQIDKDLLKLTHSSLLEKNIDGKIIPGIASLKLLEDKKTYLINLKKNISFSNGTILTSDDVIFTIEKMKDPFLKSPNYSRWFGVEYQKIDDYSLKIILPEEYYQFENILASLYILPKKQWKDISVSDFPFSNLNIKPIGSGPYFVKKVIRDNSGKIQEYQLEKNDKHHKKVFIEKITFHFFRNYEEYQESLIFSNKKILKNISNIPPELIVNFSSKKSYIESEIKKINSTRIFGIFMNKKSKNSSFDAILRQAISSIINKNNITKNILLDYAKILNSPIISQNKEEKSSFSKINIEKIKKKLIKNNFEIIEKDSKITLINKKDKKEVVLNISILNSTEFKKIAENIRKDFQKIGLKLNIKSYSETDLINNIIRQRDFELLLYGYQVELLPDFYHFFHSSQIYDPGINIMSISNNKLDSYIINLRKKISKETRKKTYKEIEKIVSSDYSFIPIYSPYFIYITDSRINNINYNIIDSLEERFSTIDKWYIETERTLPFFK